MSSQSDDKTQESPAADREGHVVEDECGHQVWQGTIKTIKLSLMKTGIFKQTKAQQRLQHLGESDSEDAIEEFDEELDIMDGGGGFDPYDSTGK